MSRGTTDYAPSTTYFVEREERIKDLIKKHSDALSAAIDRFAVVRAELTNKHGEVLSQIAELRLAKPRLMKLSETARAAADQMLTLAMQGDAIAADIASLIAEPEAQLARLDAEMASVASQLAATTAKPKKEIEKLQAKLSRLGVRRQIAEKQNVQGEVAAIAADIDDGPGDGVI